jgi:hypothetical protein
MNIKKLIKTAVLAACTIFLCACSGKDLIENKISDLEFSVIGADEQPQALKDIILQKGDDTFQLSYTIGDELYIAVGYGLQESTGYSITVNALYETKNNIVIDTSLLGPGSVENVTDTTSTPYIVIKTHNIEDKIIEFK